MAERIYYKVTKINARLYKDVDVFLAKEERLRKAQTDAIVAHLPKFTKCIRGTVWIRIPQYEGFVFDNPEAVDPKVWNTKKEGQYMISRPNKRTKVGKEMIKFLMHFERTTCWDVDALLNMDKEQIFGSFYPTSLFKHDNVIYIIVDAKFRKTFEKNNNGFIEITAGEIDKAIEAYNRERRR